MDLSAMLNGPAPGKGRPAQPESQRDAPNTTPSMPTANGVPTLSSHTSAHTTPPHAGPPGSGPPSRQGTGLTPLQTPIQQTPGAHYQSQSPAAAYPAQQYQPYGPYPASTPGPRPPSHGMQYPQASPSQYPQQQGMPPHLQHTQQTHSMSPTPPSHHSQTPHSVRHSPMSGIPYSQQQQQQPHPLYPQHYQHSQPSTPLGPPPLQYPRSTNHTHHDQQSPYHQRNISGASNGLASGSPAQHHPSIGNLVESPSAHPRETSHLRRTSEYLAQQGRERSVSVSPKTKVPPRVPSRSESRHSSQQDIYNTGTSARTSLQHQTGSGVAQLQETQGHVLQPSPAVAQPIQTPLPHSRPSEVAQHTSLTGQVPFAETAAPAEASSLSNNSSNPVPQQPIQHQPHRMDMNHLLTPATSVRSMDGANESAGHLPPQQQQQQQQKRLQDVSIFMKPSPKPKKPAVAAPPLSQQPSMEDASGAAETQAVAQNGQLAAPAEEVMKEPAVTENANLLGSKKRPAESKPASEEPPLKKEKTRKYTQRPPWARLAKDNPKFDLKTNGPVAVPPQKRPQQPARDPKQAPRFNGMPVPHASHENSPQQSRHQPPSQINGHPPPPQQAVAAGNVDLDHPWAQDPPLDTDLIKAREIFGQWEKSIRWRQPFIDMEKNIADWLYMQLASLQDVADDPSIGTIEIEAKIGKILGRNSDTRVALPVTSATTLHEGWCKENIRFESQMDEREHEIMNKFLNAAIQETLGTKGRVQMRYQHPKEIDSFQSLSEAGHAALPPSFRRRPLQKGRDLKLRTTTDQINGNITARIVKSHVADLHIYNPQFDYDCRITVNLEANMNRPELAPFENLVVDAPGDATGYKREQAGIPDRKKDRLSYRHLAYSIDLTRVDVQGIAKYELELEVDASVLRQQIAALHEQRPSGYQAVVAGFLDNAMFLMRQRTGQ